MLVYVPIAIVESLDMEWWRWKLTPKVVGGLDGRKPL